MRRKAKSLPLANPANSVGDPVAFVEQLADQLAQDGYYGLQDCSLILAETVRELQAENESQAGVDLSTLVVEWADLIDAFKSNPLRAAKEMNTYLRRPELKIPMEDDEFNMLELQLYNDANKAMGEVDRLDSGIALSEPRQLSLEEHVDIIEQLADEAAAGGLYGLQDASLLLVESLRELSTEDAAADSSLLDTLSGWPKLIAGYRQEPMAGTQAIIYFLRHPVLNIPMGDDEFTLLQEQLTAEASVSEPLEIFPVDASTEDLASAAEDYEADNNTFSEPVSSVAKELVDLLLMQSQQVRSCLQNIVIGEKDSILNGLQETADELERFANVSKTAGFEGLALVCGHIDANIQQFLEQVDAFTDERLALMLEWLEQVQEYLPSFNESNAGQLIVAGLTDEQWAVPLSFDQMAAILLQVRNESAEVGHQTEAARVETASDEDVSLALPDDVNQELLELLLQELPVHTREFSEAVQRMQSGGNEHDVEVAQRAAHTLKGSANTVGIKGIAVLTHQLEDILIACAKEQKLPNRSLANALVNASDCIETMSEALSGYGSPPDDAKAVLQEILDWANRIDKEGLPDSDAEETLPQVHVAAPDAESAIEKSSSHQGASVRVNAEQIENLFRLSGESIILNSQANENLRRIKNQLKAMELQFSLLQQLSGELEQLIDLKDLTGRSFVVGSDFDALEMDQYNELHTASRRMAEAAIDAREISLDVNKELDKMVEVLDDQQMMVVEAQEVVMQTRLVSVSTIAPRLHRSLRQTCRMTGKQGDLTLVGENIMIDGDTLNAIVDPLMHILRNAVDHGIETSDERLAQGKPSGGQLRFEFDREGNNILVRCRDDGQGLDYGAIRAAAEKRGLLQPGQEVSEEELKRFILRPNFSSRSVSTQTSGRGVGMDAVRAQIINMGGTLTLDSQKGRGMTVELRVPLPLSMTHALLTYVGHYRIAIANKGISQIVYSGTGDLVMQDDKEMLLLEGNTYPTARLTSLLNVVDQRKQVRSYGAALMIQVEDKTTAVLIGDITDSKELVIKSLGHYIGKIPGYIGATILGDGTVTPVLDIPELLRTPIRATTSTYAEIIDSAEPASHLPTVLVVDDSLSQRRALEQLLVDAGYRVRTARDGIEAAEILVQFKPDVVLTDLEMPRMNGIELAAHIRTKENIKSLPVIMITSRTTQKHRQMAQDAGVDAYFTKPVLDEDLLVKMQNLMETAVEKERKSA